MNLSRLFASNILWRGSYLITSLLVTVLMARFLEAGFTGELMYFISLFTFIFMAASFSIESALIYYSSSRKISDAKLFTFCLIWIPVIVLLFIPLFYYFFGYGKTLPGKLPLYLCGLLFMAGNLLITYFSSFFYAKHQNLYPNLIFILMNLLISGVLIWGLKGNAVISKEWFISFYFISFFIAGIFCVVIFAWYHPSAFKLSLPQKEEVNLIIKYASIAFVANILAFLLTRIDYWFIERIVNDNKELGNYIQASRLVQLFQMLPVILASTIFPAVSSGLRADMIAVVQMLSRLLLWLYLMVVLLIALTGKSLFPFLFGETFSKMYSLFLILSPGLFATSILALISAYLAAMDKVIYNMISAAIGLVFIVCIDLLIIPSYGVYGAAWVSSAGYIISLIVGYFFLKKLILVRFSDFFILRKNDLKNLRVKYMNFSFK